MNPSPATEQKIVKTTHNPVSENPGANDDGGGDRRNHGDMLGTKGTNQSPIRSCGLNVHLTGDTSYGAQVKRICVGMDLRFADW